MKLWMTMGLVALVACAPEELPEPDGLADRPEQTTHNYHTTQTEGGVKEWELWGASAARYPGDPLLRLTDIRMVFYRNGVQDAELTADTGEIDENTQDTVGRGNVVLVSSESGTLKSEVLYWNNEQELIHTDEFVEIIDGDRRMTGYGLETDPNLSNAVIQRDVQGSFVSENPPDDGQEAP